MRSKLIGLVLVCLGVGVVSLTAGCSSPGAPGNVNENDNSAVNGNDNTANGNVNENTNDSDDNATLLRDFVLPLPLFAADSAWNQRADDADVLPESDEQILVLYRVLLGDNTSLHPASTNQMWPFIDIGYDEWTVPVFAAGDGQQEVALRNYDGEPEYPHPKFGEAEEPGGPVTIPACAGNVRPSGPAETFSDGHLVLYDPDEGVAYDIWQATTQVDAAGNSLGGGRIGDEILAAGVIDFFDVSGPGVETEGGYSARAVGTPLLAGMLLPEDVENGAIEHALACAIPRTRNLSPDPFEPAASDYFYPASTTETDYYSTNPLALASGQRIRLKQSIVDEDGNSIDESELAPITRMFLAALRNYGVYVVDNADGFSFTAEDIHTANLALSNDEVNELIGESAGTPLPENKTKWQLAMEKLTEELERIPLASGPWWEYVADGGDPTAATFGVANFEIIEPATEP